MPKKGSWRGWILGGFLGIFLFTWIAEGFDFPRLFLGAPDTPFNWQESTLESIFIVIVAVISWNLLSRYERGWLRTIEELHHLANTDDLTGILSRRECLKRTEEEFERSIRFGHPLSIAIIDFDHFKSINDQFGHQRGDNVLLGFTQIVSENIRAQDLFGRWGGDEFLLAFVETTGEDAQPIIERMRDQWRETSEATLPDQTHLATISVGLASARVNDKSLADCIRRADSALYLAKARGRDRIQLG